MEIGVEGSWFKDKEGRTLILRGANLGGSSKVPFPGGATHIRAGFYDHRDVSFVGRPFPLKEADEHLARLKAWGLDFLRLLVTWEAVEHAGPGLYDEAYLDYLYEIVRRAGSHGIRLFVDPHQDAWSRLSGGDGAPGWTLEAVGMDVTRLSETGAAIAHAVHGDPFPHMTWPTNYGKLASATMFTLFFGGDDFAPRTRVDGEPVQAFLQRHYLAAMEQVARRLAGLSNVVGYDAMNEPSAGYIGWPDLAGHHLLLRQGSSPTPFQSMLLGAGFPQEVGVWAMTLLGPRRRGRHLANPRGVRAWREGYHCVWQENGVWDVNSQRDPHLLRPDHFFRVRGQVANFAESYLRPFLERYARTIRAVDPEALIFLEAPPGSPPPRWNPREIPHVIHAAHWYDGFTLFFKRFVPFLGVVFNSDKVVVGRRRVQRSFTEQLARLKAATSERMGGIPTLVGEFGIPLDLGKAQAYRTGDFSRQAQALDRTFRALDANLLSGTLWNYTADNDNERGDQWNGEDFSIFSRDQQADPHDVNSGGRALQAAVRPYARAVAGEPLDMTFDYRAGTFEFAFRHDPAIRAATEIFVPTYQYRAGCHVEVSDGTYELDRSTQTLRYHHGPDRKVHRIRLRRLKE
jgi:hypothetical protein